MIQLKNIEKNNNTIQCLIIPEDSKETGTLNVDLSNDSFEYSLPNGYEWCESHVHHAVRALIDMAKSNSLVKEKLIMWY